MTVAVSTSDHSASPGSWGATAFDTDRRAFFIGGAWVAPLEAHPPIPVLNPATTRVIGSVPAAGPGDVNRAVRAARAAFTTWSISDPALRSRLLRALAAGLRSRSLEMATLISSEMGAPLDNALGTQTGLAIEVIESYADLIDRFEWREPLGSGLVVHEPAGVVAAITAWNYPLYLAVTKVAAALGAGCTVVLKPSEDAPLDAYLLAEILDDACREVGTDSAIVNVITGAPDVVGEALVTHPDIDVVSFTGSTPTGRRVAELAGTSLKRVGLELGGKSACVVLPDTKDGGVVTGLEHIIREALVDVFFNSGQTCTARTRLLVPSAVYNEAVELAARGAEQFRLGDPSQPGDHLGPVAGRRHYESICKRIEQGISTGGRLVTGGPVPRGAGPAGFEDGFWVRPTVFADVSPASAIVREEIFGPVICLLSYADEAEALRLANDSPYGLSGAVWCADEDRAVVFSLRMRTGSVTVNGAEFDPRAPAGGYKQSGIGRELGKHGLLEYLEVKSVQLPAARS